jgi:hypothetical protein
VRPLEIAVGAQLASRLLSATEHRQRNVAVAAAVAAVRAAQLLGAVLDLIEPGNHWAAQDLAGPEVRPEAVGQACRHITQAWRDVLDTTFPGRELTVDWDPQERIVTAYSRA